jgi:PHD/YefM family antitoxin component YafN of YafNO toxin-antitoxin module
MGTLETRNRIHNVIDEIPPEKLHAVLDFLEDLQRSSDDETPLLLSDPGFLEEYREAKDDIRTGKTVSFNSIRRDV